LSYENGNATDDRMPVSSQKQMKETMEMQIGSLAPRMKANRKTDRQNETRYKI
jgi:hypothetical protein